jgi:hypothetical protein
MTEPLIFELSRPGRCAAVLPDCDVPRAELPEGLVREDLPLPEVSEPGLVRHYTHLSQMNYGVDTGFYPLGSCTMKYNPKINEEMARLPGFANLHPYQAEDTVQGALFLMYYLQEFLQEIGGFTGCSLQPAAGAHGELTGVLMIRACQLSRGQDQRNVILVPDSAHGTNPATTTMSGLRVVEIPSGGAGGGVPEARRPPGGHDADQPQHAGAVRRTRGANHWADSRTRWADVRRRGEHECPPGNRPPGRPGLRRPALQSAQDVQHAPRWRWSWLRASLCGSFSG